MLDHWRVRVAMLGLLVGAGGAACGGGGGTSGLTVAELMDPATCQTCHPQQFSDWSGSMHAYSSVDPVFVAMNTRAQRETNGALGTFCVKCHAPVAVAQGLTQDGLNLATLPATAKGVTCFFCHSASGLGSDHDNNPIQIATDGSLFGPFGDPVAGTPHKGIYSPLFDLSRPESAAACGGCHDIVNKHDAPVERTYVEWGKTLFSDPTAGQTCVRCHMSQTTGPASTMSAGKTRSLGSHALPGVDVALTADFPEADTQHALVQQFLDSTLQGTLCLDDTQRIQVTLDNVNAGHFWPSGATPDRRAWIEVTAYSGDQVIYQSGVVPDGQSVETLDDPDLWLIRDCLYDDQMAPVDLFWQAFSISPSNQIPGPVLPKVTDPTSFSRSHVKYVFPAGTAAPLPVRPDRVTLSVHIKPIGDDVLDDLVKSQDLDPAVAAKVPVFTLGEGAAMEWTAAKAVAPLNIQNNQRIPNLACVGTETQIYRVLGDVAVSRARCP
jgi:Cytochrome c554 and c-prime